MIFLAVSGMMFVIAANFINGKQQKAEFRQGMNGINAQIQQIANDVVNGYYPSNDNVSCTLAPTGEPVIGSSTQERGTNNDCVFLGKIIQFKAGGEPTTYKVTTVAGRQSILNQTATDSPTNYVQAQPTISASDLVNETKKLEWGLEVVKMSSSTIGDLGAVGFLSGFAQGTESSGPQSIFAVPIRVGLGTAVTSLNAAQLDIDAKNTSPEVITICFKGGNDQYGTITIGGKGQRGSSVIKVGTNDPASIPGCA